MATRDVPINMISFNTQDEFIQAPEPPQGVFTVYIDGVPTDFDYEDRGYETTAVFFHAALGSKVVSLPMFQGRGISEEAPVNRLFVSDPSLNLDESLRLAWFAGNSRQPTLQRSLALIFAKITQGRRAIYFGASGGGYAALYYSAVHNGSLAIPVNPQTNIADYGAMHVAIWTNHSWGMDNAPGDREMVLPPVVTNLRELYAGRLKNHVVYVQNSGDRTHMPNQWKPFELAVHAENSIIPLIEFSAKGHVAPPARYLMEILDRVARTKNWKELDLTSIAATPVRSSAKKPPTKGGL